MQINGERTTFIQQVMRLIHDVLKQRIIASPSDEVVIVFYNTVSRAYAPPPHWHAKAGARRWLMRTAGRGFNSLGCQCCVHGLQ